MQVDGDLVINITGEQSAAHIRVPQIDAIADSRIHNMGKLILERNATHHESIENSGELSINATTVMRGLETLNNEGGMIIQSSIIETSTGVSVRNFGTWNCRSSSQIKLAMDTDAASTFFLNGGEFLASSGTTSVDIAFLNEGQVITDGAEVIFSRTTTVDQDGRRVLSGKWKTINGGRITVSQDPPTVVAGEETIIEGEGSGFSFVEDLEFIKSGAKVRLGFAELTKPLVINSGSLNVKPNATIDVRGTVTAILESEVNVEPGATLNADGAINVGSADPMTPSVLDDLSGSIAIARGNPNPPNVNAPMINIHANLTPIRGDTGTMNTSGLLTIHPTGTLRINAEANGISSAIDHTGDLDITGSISITPIQGYEPQLGDSFTIATVSGTIGSLPAQAIDTSGSGLTFSVGAVGSDVVVTVIESCPADLNMDGTLNFFDVSAFLTAFISMDPIADFTGDGIFNFFDVSAFLASYSAGCP